MSPNNFFFFFIFLNSPKNNKIRSNNKKMNKYSTKAHSKTKNPNHSDSYINLFNLFSRNN